MRAAVVTIPSAMNPSPTMIISTLIFSRVGICFGGFMVLRLLAGTMVDRRSVGRRKAGHTARRCDCNARFCCVRVPHAALSVARAHSALRSVSWARVNRHQSPLSRLHRAGTGGGERWLLYSIGSRLPGAALRA